MKKSLLIPILCVFAAAVLLGCASNQPSILQSNFKPQVFKAEEYQPKVDNFMVVFDASASMAYYYKDSNRMNTAKAIVSNLNKSLPELPMKGSLRSFGHASSLFKEMTVLQYGLTAYTKSGFEGGLAKLTKSGGNSPMTAAIDAAGEDFASAEGKIALIIVSDGHDMGEAPIRAAEKLKDVFGERLCIYTIHVGDNAAGGALLSKIAQAGECGYAKSDDELTSSSAMFAFVKDVFLEKRMDVDQDGVYDDQDNCPNTQAGVKVDASGCPLDSDDDGVADFIDQCPDTPEGTQVDYAGCPSVKATNSAQVMVIAAEPKIIVLALEDVHFDFDKSTLTNEAQTILKRNIQLLKENPKAQIRIAGYTSAAGTEAINQKLSERRANAVKAYLVNEGIIAPDRLSTIGYGATNPAMYEAAPKEIYSKAAKANMRVLFEVIVK